MAETEPVKHSHEEGPVNPVIGFRHIQFDRYVATAHLVVNGLNNLMSQANVLVNTSPFDETRLLPRYDRW